MSLCISGVAAWDHEGHPGGFDVEHFSDTLRVFSVYIYLLTHQSNA